MMNKKAWIFVAAAMGAWTLMSFNPAELQAQSSMRLDVPFDFHVGSQKLPPGRYTVKHMSDPAVLHFSDRNGHAAVTFSNSHYNRSVPRAGQLIFTRYGNQYFLSEVRWEDTALSRQLMKSSLETQLARGTSGERITATTNNR
jgi:hypothetical protein